MHFIYNLLPKTLFARFMLIIIIPVLLCQGLVIYLFYYRHWYNVSYHTSQIITDELTTLIKILNKEEAATLNYTIERKNELPPTSTNLRFELEILYQSIKNNIPFPSSIEYVEGQNKITIHFLVNGNLISKTLYSKALTTPTTQIFILWLIFLNALLITISLIFAKNQIRSILNLANAANSFRQGKEYKKFHPSGAREIRAAGLAFIQMREKIVRAMVKRTEFLAMISHDLRTPLTRLKLQLELLPRNEDIDSMKQDVQHMEKIINSYILFSRNEIIENFEVVGLKDLLTGIITKNKFDNIVLEASADKLNVSIKPAGFERAIVNIINNSMNYASQILISLYKKNKNVIIDIEDNGPGISDEEKLFVFKAFYKVDKSRNLNDNANIGLGLAITKEIILSLGGDVLLYDSSKLGGLLTRIILPQL